MNMFKKVLLSILMVLSIAGLGFCAAIPGSIDPKAGPETWVMSVYNNSGSALDVGDVVIWDIVSSTGDNDNYITTTTTADTKLVAGVVYPSAIAIGDIGTIAIYGVASCDLTDNLPQNTLLCTSTTAGSSRSCATNASAYGFSTTPGTAGGANTNCFITLGH